MPWQLYLVISIILISCNGLYHRSLMKDDASDAKAQTIVFLGIGGIFALLIALLRGKLQLSFPIELLGNFIIVGIFSTIAYVLSYRAYQLIGASEIAIFLTTGKLWTMLGAFLFLHEVITLPHIIGAVIILAGVVVARIADGKFTVNKGIVIVLLAAFFSAFSDISGYRILQTTDALSYQIYTQFLPVILLLLLFPRTVTHISYYFTKERGLKIILLSIGDVIGMLALFLAYQAGGKASVIGPLSATRVILTVLLAALFLDEKTHIKNKLVGAAIALLGAILLV